MLWVPRAAIREAELLAIDSSIDGAHTVMRLTNLEHNQEHDVYYVDCDRESVLFSLDTYTDHRDRAHAYRGCMRSSSDWEGLWRLINVW